MTIQLFQTAAATDAVAHTESILETARQLARLTSVDYAGSVSPSDAWTLFSNGHAQLVDVRTIEERTYVGRVPNSLHVAWQTGTSMSRNPRFLRELEKLVPKDAVLLLLCRSGNRSAAAAAAATAAGFTQVFNVLTGFEGALDGEGHRGGLGGWRFEQLPWVQD